MRRARSLAAVAGAILLIGATAALAATPQQINADLAAHGKLTKHYSAADLRNAKLDASVQGYGTPPQQALQPAVQQVAGAQHTQSRCAESGSSQSGAVSGASASTCAHAAPAAVLPFTGLQLSVFVGVGLALIAGGLLIRRLSRSRA